MFYLIKPFINIIILLYELKLEGGDKVKKLLSFILTICLILTLACNKTFADSQNTAQNVQNQSEQAQTVGVTYQAHVQNVGWQNFLAVDGQESGTTGQGLRLEALKINLTNAPANATIKYQAHIQNIGWQNNWIANGETAGTVGQGLRMEAIKILLDGVPGYSVQYRTHVENIGWQPWVCDGQVAGTVGQALRIEAIQIRIVPTVHPTALTLSNNSISLAVNEAQTLTPTFTPENTTNQAISWTSSDNKIAAVDSTGKVTGIAAGSAIVTATTDDGNKTATCNVTVNNVGVTGISLNKATDTLPIGGSDTLVPTISPTNATNQNVTWTSSNSAVATVDSSGKVTGLSVGNSVQITATTSDGNKTASCTVNVVEPSLTYTTHVENIGWQNSVSDGQTAGTVGQSLRVEALKINLNNAPAGAKIKYQTYVQNVGWQSAVEDGSIAGTTGQSLRIEALKISLENMPGYSIEYRAHVQNIGWQSWVMDGNTVGTEGRALRIEAIEIKLIKSVDAQYQTYVENDGWQTPVTSGAITGSNGQQPLKAEALTANLLNAPAGASIQYQAYIENKGWQSWYQDGQTVGYAASGLGIEAINMKLVNLPGYDVQYQVYVKNKGWQPWYQNGYTAGFAASGLVIEGIRVRVVKAADATTFDTPAQTSTSYSLTNYLSSNSNIASVNARAIQLHNGETANNCVFFSSEALRRIGFNVPLWMCNTKSYVPYLLNSGWKSNYNIDALAPGDICFSVDDSEGHPTHTYVFMGWVNPDDHTLAYVADNQNCNSIHLRSMIDAPGIDAFHFFVSY